MHDLGTHLLGNSSIAVKILEAITQTTSYSAFLSSISQPQPGHINVQKMWLRAFSIRQKQKRFENKIVAMDISFSCSNAEENNVANYQLSYGNHFGFWPANLIIGD